MQEPRRSREWTTSSVGSIYHTGEGGKHQLSNLTRLISAGLLVKALLSLSISLTRDTDPFFQHHLIWAAAYSAAGGLWTCTKHGPTNFIYIYYIYLYFVFPEDWTLSSYHILPTLWGQQCPKIEGLRTSPLNDQVSEPHSITDLCCCANPTFDR